MTFTNPTSGWPEAKFDNYFIGYHEPEYYHVEVVSPNFKTTVFEPEKTDFGGCHHRSQGVHRFQQDG